jgi:transcriptional regulator with XRE-family HTH domain
MHAAHPLSRFILLSAHESFTLRLVSLFISTLTGLMALEDPPLQQGDLAERTGISQSTISRILAGREPMPEQVGKLCSVISDDRARRLDLLLAWLRDCAAVGVVAGLDERHFVLGPVADAASTGTLSAELELVAAECADHDDIRALVADMAAMIRRHRAELLDAAGAPLPFRVCADLAVAEPVLGAPSHAKRSLAEKPESLEADIAQAKSTLSAAKHALRLQKPDTSIPPVS